MGRYRHTRTAYRAGDHKPASPFSFNLRCNNKMHKITLTSKGELVLHGHPHLSSEKMLQHLNKEECSCLRVLRQWKTWEPRRNGSRAIHPKLKKARLAAIDVKENRKYKHTSLVYRNSNEEELEKLRGRLLKNNVNEVEMNLKFSSRIFRRAVDRIASTFYKELEREFFVPLLSADGIMKCSNARTACIGDYDDVARKSLTTLGNRQRYLEYCGLGVSVHKRRRSKWNGTIYEYFYDGSGYVDADDLPIEFWNLYKKGEHIQKLRNGQKIILIGTDHGYDLAVVPKEKQKDSDPNVESWTVAFEVKTVIKGYDGLYDIPLSQWTQVDK